MSTVSYKGERNSNFFALHKRADQFTVVEIMNQAKKVEYEKIFITKHGIFSLFCRLRGNF
jgi:hypothetical protein